MQSNVTQKTLGLTLIEVLIALAIITIAFSAILFSTSQNIRNTQYIQSKQTANWVGTEIMNKALAGILKPPISDVLNGETEALGHQWFWKVGMRTTPNPKILKVSVHVAESENGKKIISLVSYVYNEK